MSHDHSPRSVTDSKEEDAQALKKQLEEAREQAQHYKRLLHATEATLVDEEEKKAGLKMTPTELETIKAIFEVFDTNNNGSINIADIKSIHAKLGEPLTDEEAAEAIADIDTHKTGNIEFDAFLQWWRRAHSTKNKMSKYHTRFKMLSAKLTDHHFAYDRVKLKAVGEPGTTEYRMVFYYKTHSGALKQISPWHDVPLHHVGKELDAKIFNFVCEVPKWTRAKYEIATGEPYNPIKQDIKHGVLRFYKWGDMMFNYGAFPQTWEDPKHVNPDTKAPGDNDPIDVIELGTRQLPTGSITQVKVLGVLALIDDGETDWKIIAISINDPLAHLMQDIDDVEEQIPGAIHAIREYFRVYKVAHGQPENKYALRAEAMPRSYAIKIVEECHQAWKALADNKQTVVSKEDAP